MTTLGPRQVTLSLAPAVTLCSNAYTKTYSNPKQKQSYARVGTTEMEGKPQKEPRRSTQNQLSSVLVRP